MVSFLSQVFWESETAIGVQIILGVDLCLLSPCVIEGLMSGRVCQVSGRKRVLILRYLRTRSLQDPCGRAIVSRVFGPLISSNA